MGRPCLVAHIAHDGLLVDKKAGKFLCRGEHAAAIAADVEDEAVAQGEVVHHLVEVSASKCRVEGRAAHIAYVVAQDAIAQGGADAVFVGTAEICTYKGVGIVGGVGIIPVGIACHVVGGIEVHMAVAQLGEHGGTDLEEGFGGHPIGDGWRIACVHFVPVYAILRLLFSKEAVVGIDSFPQSLEISCRRVGGHILGDTGGEQENPKEERETKNVGHLGGWGS